MAGGGDKVLFVTVGHRVLHDRLQIVVQHPVTCPGKGAADDKRKTFHRWPLALEKLTRCGVSRSADQEAQLITTGKQVDAAPR